MTLAEEIEQYMKATDINSHALSRIIGVPYTTVRHFFKMKGQGPMKIVHWYFKQVGGVPQWKKNIICKALDDGENVEDIKAYIATL